MPLRRDALVSILGVAIAELFRTDGGDHLGIAASVGGTEGFEVLCNCILVRAGKGGNGAQEAKRKHRKGELTAIDLHGVSSRFECRQSCSRAAACRALGKAFSSDSAGRLKVCEP